MAYLSEENSRIYSAMLGDPPITPPRRGQLNPSGSTPIQSPNPLIGVLPPGVSPVITPRSGVLPPNVLPGLGLIPAPGASTTAPIITPSVPVVPPRTTLPPGAIRGVSIGPGISPSVIPGVIPPSRVEPGKTEAVSPSSALVQAVYTPPTTEGRKIMPLVLLGGAGLLLYFLFKK